MKEGEALPLDQFRDYLLLLANVQVGKNYQGKFDASDIVQQVMLEAHRSRETFRGKSAAEQAGWLRHILATKMAKAMRDLGRAKRDMNREQAIRADLDASSARLEGWLIADQSSPSYQVQHQEQVLGIASALARLPDGQREAMILRHCQGWQITEIARHFDCSLPTVVGLIQRGSRRLRELMDEQEKDKT